jgi:uncharacterized protein YkwD
MRPLARLLARLLLVPVLAAGCVDLGSKTPLDADEVRLRTPRPAPSRAAESPDRLLEDRRSALIERINDARRREGEPRLARHAALERAAQRHAEEMVERRYFAHEDARGGGPRDRAEAAGYRAARRVGEALAWGDDATPASTVDDWLASPSHREILLDARYADVGVGVAVRPGRRYDRLYWVALLAAPPPPRNR